MEHAVARSLAETDRPSDVYPRVLASVGQALGWQLGAAWESSGDGELRCVEVWQQPGLDAHGFAELSRETRLEPGQGLPGRVWLTGAPSWIVDVVEDTNFPRARGAAAAGLHAACCFPIRGSASTILGAVEFFAAELQGPDAELLATMASLGSQIGQFVERRRAEEIVAEAGETKRAMLAAALDCIVTMDEHGRVVDFNPAAERTFGYSAEEAVGEDMGDLIVPPSLRQRHREGLKRYLDGGEATVLDRRIEVTGMRRDGSELPVELTITRIDVPGPPRFTGYLRDITDRKQAELDLRASRARLVDAADTERRRLERDLHDGAQQRLVSLALALRMGRAKVEVDPSTAAELLDEAIEDLHAATRELRELARGIHPAALTEGGLEAALPGLLARLAVPATLVAAPAGRLPEPVEAAAYFVVAEGLTNLSRYAEAGRAEIEASRRDGQLVVEVRDDGRGGADPAGGGRVCAGSRDRVTALDGRLEVESPAG